MSIYFFFVLFPLILIGAYWLSVKSISSKASKMAVELLSTCKASDSVKEIQMKFQENDGMKARVWPKGYCDVYFCENFAIVLKRHHFIIPFQSKPIVFGPKVPAKISIHEKSLVKATASKIKIGEFFLVFGDKNFQHYKYEVTLSGLNAQQIDRFNQLASWIESD